MNDTGPVTGWSGTESQTGSTGKFSGRWSGAGNYDEVNNIDKFLKILKLYSYKFFRTRLSGTLEQSS